MKWELNVIQIFLLSTVFHTAIMGMARLLELNLNEFDCDLHYRYIDTLTFEWKLTDIQDYRSDPTFTAAIRMRRWHFTTGFYS